MTTNFILNEKNLSTDTIINMTQNTVTNLPLPVNESDFVNQQYIDEQISIVANADKIAVESDSSPKETVQQVLEKLTNQSQGFLLKSGGSMNAS